MTERSSGQPTAPDTGLRSLTAQVNGLPVHYVERGAGTPVLALHGWFVDHRLMTGCLDADRSGYRALLAEWLDRVHECHNEREMSATHGRDSR